MPEHDYRKDHVLREAITELLTEHHYSVEAFSLSDKPIESDETRTLTLKASRSLTFEQQRMTLSKAE